MIISPFLSSLASIVFTPPFCRQPHEARSGGDDEKKLLILVDGKEITKIEMEALNPDKIVKMNVFKGKKAIEKYGKKGGNGVIVITTKKQ